MKLWERIRIGLFLLLCFGVAMVWLGREISNPEMTRIQLLISFWYDYLLGVIAIIWGYIVVVE